MRLSAVAFDVLILAGLGMLSFVAAFAWLLLRSSAGRDDLTEFEALVAVALVTSTIPGWLAWQAVRLYTEAATSGQQRTGLRVRVQRGTSRRWCVVRLLVHPLALPAWGWLAVIVLLGEVPWLIWPVAAGTGLVAIGGLGSLVLFLGWPARRAVHDLVAGTGLERVR